MEISSTTAHHQKLIMAAGASSSIEQVAVWCNWQPSPAATETQATVERKPRPNPNQEIKCARCNSTKTKFCYYNNYSMAQPRYFCKQCRRYWTQGGSLRNVPIGGGCRKNRRSSSTSASVSAPLSAASKINKLILTGGLLDGNHQSNGNYGGNGMVMPPPTFGLNLTMQQHGLGGTADHAIGGTTATQRVLDGSMDAGEEGGGGMKAMMGLQWPSQLGGGGSGSAGRQLLRVGAEQQQGTVNSNNVMMDDDDDNNGCYWNNEGVGTASSANPWQALINSSSLI